MVLLVSDTAPGYLYYLQVLLGMLSMDELDKNDAISRQAAKWYLQIVDKGKLADCDQHAFLKWQKAADRHVVELIKMFTVDRFFRGVDRQRRVPGAVAATLLNNKVTSRDRAINPSPPAKPSPNSIATIKVTSSPQIELSSRPLPGPYKMISKSPTKSIGDNGKNGSKPLMISTDSKLF